MVRQRCWKSMLKADPTEWLLEEDNPVVRYWALRDLAGGSRRQVEAARRRALGSAVVKEVLRQQRPRGHWEDPGNLHAPHYTSTIYQLSLRGDLGLTAKDPGVAKGVEVVLGTQRADGGFPGHDPGKCPYGPYDIGLILRFMHQFGLGADPRASRMVRWVRKHQMPDGGWVGGQGRRRPRPRGCLNATANVLWGLAAAGQSPRTAVARKGLGFLREAAASLRDRDRGLGYPQFWNFWLDAVKIAEICLGLGAPAGREPLRGALGAILSLQQSDGRWPQHVRPYPDKHNNCNRMRALFPREGEPSKWVTAKAMIVLKQAHGGARR
jgi:hypothetical protein